MYRLHFLINVFGVSPTFLLPIFKKENDYFFQVIEDGLIKSFEKADLKQFNECNRYYVKSLTYMVHENCSPVFGIETPNCIDYYVGKQTDVLYFFKQNIEEYQQFCHFCNAMNNFKMTDLESNNKLSLTVYSKKNRYLIPLDFKKNIIKNYLYGKFRGFLDKKMVFYNRHNIIKKRYFPSKKYIDNKNLYITEIENKNVLFNSDCSLECDNIFDIFEIVNNKKLFRIHPIIVNNRIIGKIPLSIQIDLLNDVYYKKGVFTTNDIYNIYLKRNYNNSFYNYDKNEIQNMLKNDWKLNVISEINTIDLYENIIQYDELMYTFYFGVKKLSKKDYAIIAESIYSRELYVKFSDNNLTNNDIISFINYLYLKIQHTVNLTPCCDESKVKIFNDEFSRWLELNEDICSIKGLQNFVSTHF